MNMNKTNMTKRVWLPEKVGGSGRIKDCRALQKRWLDGEAKSCRDGGVMRVVGGCRGWGGGMGGVGRFCHRGTFSRVHRRVDLSSSTCSHTRLRKTVLWFKKYDLMMERIQ